MRTSIPLLVALACGFSNAASAQELEVLRATQITEGAGGFTGTLDIGDRFGESVAGLGDLNGDGVEDLAVGTMWDDDGGVGENDRGAVYVLFLNADGSVDAHQKISALEGGFTGTLEFFDNFGSAVAPIGDLDGDGVTELAVGASGTGSDLGGGVWILFLNADGTVKAQQRIADGVGGFTGPLDDDSFGDGVTALGDLDGDGVTELAVGAPLDDDNDPSDPFGNGGAVWVLFLNADGTVKAQQKISPLEGGFTGDLDGFDNMGKDVAAIGDLDGNGVTDLAAGAWADDEGRALGAVWILFLNADGTVAAEQKISETQGGFTGALTDFANFGSSVAALGDLDGDGVPDLAVGAWAQDIGRGSVWLLYLNADGTVKGHGEISNTTPGLENQLDEFDFFGGGVTRLGDLDGDGLLELAVGAPFDSEAEPQAGAAWVLSLNIAKSTAAEGGEPSAFALDGPHPNPSSGQTALSFTLEAPARVRLALYDVLGREVAVLVDSERAAGRHEAVLEAPDLPGGTYLVRMEAASAAGVRVQVRPVTILR